MSALGKCRICDKEMKKGFFANFKDEPYWNDATICQSCADEERLHLKKEVGSDPEQVERQQLPQEKRERSEERRKIASALDEGSITGPSVTDTSFDAIGYLTGINTAFLVIQLLSAIASPFLIPNVNGLAIGFGIFLGSLFLWAFIRVIIGVAQDVKAMRANADTQLSRHLNSEDRG